MDCRSRGWEISWVGGSHGREMPLVGDLVGESSCCCEIILSVGRSRGRDNASRGWEISRIGNPADGDVCLCLVGKRSPGCEINGLSEIHGLVDISCVGDLVVGRSRAQVG